MAIRREHKGGAPRTTLASTITAAADTFQAADASGYPSGGVGPFIVVLDAGTAAEEKILCASRSGNVFTVAGSGRGYDDTVPVGHNAPACTIDHVLGAVEVDEANAHLMATTDIHGRTGALLSLTEAQTPTNKTLSGATNTFLAIPQSAVTNLVADLAAKLAKADVHDSWEAALAVALAANWAGAFDTALGAGWQGVFDTDLDPTLDALFANGLGTNWSSALQSNLDADAASLLAAIANGWVAILQAAPGSNWPAALAAGLDADAATALGAMGTGWPATLAATIASLRPQQDEDTTDLLNVSNTSPSQGSPVCGVTLVAPPSGMVEVEVSGYIDSETDGQTIVLGWQQRTGSTIGSGTLELDLTDHRAIMAGEVVNASSPHNEASSNSFISEGLTPGNSYNWVCAHYVTGAATCDIFARRISVKPIL